MLCEQKTQVNFDRHGSFHPSLNFQEENRVYHQPRCVVPEWIIATHMFSFEEGPKLYCPLSNLGWKYRTHQTQLGSCWHFKQPSKNKLTVMRTCLWGNFPSNSKVWRAASYKEYVDMIKLVRRRFLASTWRLRVMLASAWRRRRRRRRLLSSCQRNKTWPLKGWCSCEASLLPWSRPHCFGKQSHVLLLPLALMTVGIRCLHRQSRL